MSIRIVITKVLRPCDLFGSADIGIQSDFFTQVPVQCQMMTKANGTFLTDGEIDSKLAGLTITTSAARHDPKKHKVERGPTGKDMFSWEPAKGVKQFASITIGGANTIIRLRSDEAEEKHVKTKRGFSRHPSNVLYGGVPDAGKIDGEGDFDKGVTVKFDELKTDKLKTELKRQVKNRFAKIAKAARDNGYCKVTIEGNALTYSTDHGIVKKVPKADQPQDPARHEYDIEN